MLQHSITKDEIMMIANEFVQGLDPQQTADQEHVATARHLYRSGVVYNVDFDGYTLSGTVDAEGSVYSVHIPIRNVAESYCDCFAPTQCEHMLAVLLSAASSFGQVGDVLTLFKIIRNLPFLLFELQDKYCNHQLLKKRIIKVGNPILITNMNHLKRTSSAYL